MSKTTTAPPLIKEDIWRGAAVNGRVLIALIFREAAMRFGSGPISYLWTLIEPSLFIALLLFFRIYVKDTNPAFGDSSMVFLLTGFVSLRAVRSTINKGGRAIASNIGLFEFGAIHPIDTVIAKTILEFTIWLLILTAFFTAARYVLNQSIITDFQGFVVALLLILYFCIATAMFNATVGAILPIWRSIWRMLSLPLYVTSGILFVPTQMPPELLNIIVWNPFLQCVEALRSNSYLDYITVYSPSYLMSFSTTVLILSLTVERLFRKEILKSREDDEGEDEI
jgi:capsular polysaccharide transport system permease protein